jgi:hypothetical protein
VDGGVVAQDVVAKGGCHHGVPHAGGWPSDGVGSEVDRGESHG